MEKRQFDVTALGELLIDFTKTTTQRSLSFIHIRTVTATFLSTVIRVPI